ncbi:MAG: hypothetical protein ACHQ0J_13900 [Candidatus Dormibacterales bacterium]
MRGPGPLAPNCSRFSDQRRRTRGDCLADDSTVGILCEHPDPFALRVARSGARTRCRPSIAKCLTGVRCEASPRMGNAGDVPAPIPVLAAYLGDITINDTTDFGDV